MKQARLLLILLFLSMMFFAGCWKMIDPGIIENSVYKNSYFGLTASIPSGWYVEKQSNSDRTNDVGRKLFAGNDKNLMSLLMASEGNVVLLFSAYKYLVGAPVDFNPSIMCMAENVSDWPGIKRGEDMLFHLKKNYESGQLKIVCSSKMPTEYIGGREFGIMHCDIPIAGTTIKQDWYASIIKGYALCFVLTFKTDEERASMQNMLKSVTIN